MNFYDQWLGLWDQAEEERAKARRSIQEHELEWVETRQDAKAALMVAPETGFRTWGSVTMTAEIPVGWKTGAHKHGEEVIHIVRGEGFSVVADRRYDWRAGSTMAIPFGARHQHFNTGDVPVRYVSTLSVHLEHLAGVHRTVQFEDCGAVTGDPAAGIPVSADGCDENGRRITIHLDDVPDQMKDTDPGPPPEIKPGSNLVLGTVERAYELQASHHAHIYDVMRVGTTMNGFEVREQEMSSILEDPPRSYGGKHAHMEAHLYVLSGSGYTEMGGEKVPWSTGSAIHIPGPQTVHQHFNDGDEPSRMVRIATGFRYFMEKAAQAEFPYLLFEYKNGGDGS